MTAKCWVALLLIPMMHAATAGAQSAPEPIRYTLSFPAPQTHYVEVTAAVPTGRRADVELMMAVWTPGSYLVREYARNVEALTALGPDGRALDVDKSKKNHWRIATGGAAAITATAHPITTHSWIRRSWSAIRPSTTSRWTGRTIHSSMWEKAGSSTA